MATSTSYRALKHSPTGYGDRTVGSAAPPHRQSAFIVDSVPVKVKFLNRNGVSHFVTATLGPSPSLTAFAPAHHADDDPFRPISSLELPSEPNDLCVMTLGDRDMMAVPMVNGRVVIAEPTRDEAKSISGLQKFHEFKTHDAEATCACESGTNLLVGGSDGAVVIIDAATDETTFLTKTGSGVDSIAVVSGQSHLIATGHMAGMLNWWDTRLHTKRLVCSMSGKMPNDAVTSVSPHPALNSVMVSGRESGTVSFHDLRKGIDTPDEWHSFRICDGPINQVAFHPRYGDNLFIATDEGSLIHWDPFHRAIKMGMNCTRIAPWFNTNLEESSELTALISSVASSVNAFDVRDESLVAVGEDQMVRFVNGVRLA